MCDLLHYLIYEVSSFKTQKQNYREIRDQERRGEGFSFLHYQTGLVSKIGTVTVPTSGRIGSLTE